MIILKKINVRMFIKDCTDASISNAVQELLKKVKMLDRKAIVEVAYAGRYWKFPDESEVILSVKSRIITDYLDIIKLFDLQWFYYSSDAGWSKHMQENESFLLEAVSWVSIYNLEAQKVIGNLPEDKAIITLGKNGEWYETDGTLSKPLDVFLTFLFCDIGQGLNEKKFNKLENAQHEEFIRCSLKRVDNLFYINYIFFAKEDLIIAVPELISLVKQWQELTANKVSPITITDKDGKIEISPQISSKQ